jgi:CubicO group peptidase (beta-lactamase class C family)
VEANRPVGVDTLFRIYSMTKPITSVAAMMLYEEGAFELNDPIAKWLPEFADCRVYVAGSAQKPVTAPLMEPIRVWHLLTHTSGLTYGFHHAHPVDAMYRAMGHEWGSPPGADSAECCRQWASVPLAFQPGSEWNYGVSTDVLGRLVEVLSGRPLDEFFAERIFAPLGMRETSFGLRPDDDPASLARLYLATPGQPGGPSSGMMFSEAFDAAAHTKPAFLSGGGGLVSTAGDYLRFVELLRRGGSYDGGRLLGSRTIAHMVRNHLPGNQDLETFGRPLFAETPLRGVGFGLGFSMVIDPTRYGVVASLGDYGWGGAASTAFYVDPVEDVTVSFYTQLLPSSTLPIRNYLRALVNQALVD